MTNGAGISTGRIRFPLEIIEGIRREIGDDFIIIYRLSMLDLVKDGSTWDEVVSLARRVEEAGATMINTGIGWHEARVPTIATVVPRAGFAWVTKRLMGEVGIPLVATNRINMPEVAENVLAEGCADMVSMARPFLADPDWVNKAREGREREINTCIACNQACLDRIFARRSATCLVNPRACRETLMPMIRAKSAKTVAVVGGGPAGLACAVTAAARGHRVTLFEASEALGGQFLLARHIPGKDEFSETLRYFTVQLQLHEVDLRLGHRAVPADLNGFEEIVLATGVTPRIPRIPGVEMDHVAAYNEVLTGRKAVGDRVAIIGAGGIGFDLAVFLLHKERNGSAVDAFLEEWGVDRQYTQRGGLCPPRVGAPPREIHVLQRKKSKPGATLGKTTGWIHRMELKKHGVKFWTGVEYRCIEANGLWIGLEEEERLIPADTIVLCAGQESDLRLAVQLDELKVGYHLIGGAEKAVELDAQRAIEEGTKLADTF